MANEVSTEVIPAPRREEGVYEDATVVSPLAASRRFWLLVLLCVLVGGGLGLAAGLMREERFTTSARLIIGTTGSSAEALGGLAGAGPTLASAYARAATAEAVTDDVARRAPEALAAGETEISASPIPETPVLRIDVTAASEDDAVEVARAATDALVAYATRLSAPRPSPAVVLRRYRAAQQRQQEALEELVVARRRYENNPTRANGSDRAAASARFETTKLQTQSLSEAYATSERQAQTGQALRVLNNPTAASTDRDSKLQSFILIGLVAGLIIGVALALLRATRLDRS